MISSSIGLSWLNVKGLGYVSIRVDGGSVAARDELLKSLLAFLRKITLVGVSTWMEPIACLFPDSLPVISIAKRHRTTLFFWLSGAYHTQHASHGKKKGVLFVLR